MVFCTLMASDLACVRIFKTYGANAIQVMTDTPDAANGDQPRESGLTYEGDGESLPYSAPSAWRCSELAPDGLERAAALRRHLQRPRLASTMSFNLTLPSTSLVRDEYGEFRKDVGSIRRHVELHLAITSSTTSLPAYRPTRQRLRLPPG
jgi:hypothetical protein